MSLANINEKRRQWDERYHQTHTLSPLQSQPTNLRDGLVVLLFRPCDQFLYIYNDALYAITPDYRYVTDKNDDPEEVIAANFQKAVDACSLENVCTTLTVAIRYDMQVLKVQKCNILTGL